MLKNIGKTLILFVFVPIILSGCSFFNGQYHTSKVAPSANEDEADFNQADEIIGDRLADIAAGRAQAGVSAASSSEESEETLSSAPIENINSFSKNNMPPMTIDQSKKYTAVLKTEVGDIEIELFADKTPITVNNFVVLAKKDFYDHTIFHRVIKGFMIQGGDPTGTGAGGPGYSFDDESFEGEYTRGTVAMANAGPDTNGSQFFIMHTDYPLPKNYVIFGKVIKGMETVDKIAEAPVEAGPSGEGSTPVDPVKINSISIIGE